MPDEPVFTVREQLHDDELNALYAASWPDHRPRSFQHVLCRSLTWVTARCSGSLIGWVYVAADGAGHAFLLDSTVSSDQRRCGIGTRLVRIATEASRLAGAEWLHVDHEPRLHDFYAGCGFRPTPAGLIRLDRPA